MNLEQLRKQAKDLVKAARAGDADALERLDGRRTDPRPRPARRRARARLPELARARRRSRGERRGDRPRGDLRTSDPGRATPRRPARARARSVGAPRPGPRLGRGRERSGWAARVPAARLRLPLVLRDCLPLARELLARGADPNGYLVNEYGQMSALYGAAGVKHDPELTRALLKRGAPIPTTASRSTTPRTQNLPTVCAS